MLPPWRMRMLSVGVVPALILIFLLSCQGLPAHSEEHGCQPVIAATQGPSFTSSLDTPVYLCPTLPAVAVLRPVGWERPWIVPIARAPDVPRSLPSRSPPSLSLSVY